MRFMFETGLWGVEGKSVELGKWPRRSLSKLCAAANFSARYAGCFLQTRRAPQSLCLGNWGSESLISLIFDPNFNASIFGASSLRCVTGNRQNSPHTLDGLGFDATHFQLTGNHFDKFFGALDIL